MPRKRTPKPTEEKALWTQRTSSPFARYQQDFFGRKEPNKYDLIAQFQDTVYACATLIAFKIASTDINLFVETRAGQAQAKCGTRAVRKKSFDKLYRSRTKALNIHQVTDHPLLTLVSKVNQYHNKLDLIELTQLYLEITGNAYWLLGFDSLGTPNEIWLLPTQCVELDREDDGMVKGYRYLTTLKESYYSLEEVIHFKFPNLQDPYGEGLPPLRAAWDIVQIASKQHGYLDATLTNNARPDAVLAPTSPDSPIGPQEAERLAKDFQTRFAGAGSGGVMVLDNAMTLTPLGWNPKDLAGLEIAKAIKTSVCNTYHVPISMLEEQDANYASASVAKENLAINCLVPRMSRIIDKLNAELAPRFDERLFFQYDDAIIPLDREYELNRLNSLSDKCIITRQERREAEGYEPADWADAPLLPSGVLPMPAEGFAPEQPMEAPVDAIQAVQSEASPADDAATALRATVGALTTVTQMQVQVAAGDLPRESAVAAAEVLLGLTPEQSARLFPDLPIKPKLEPAPQPAPQKSKSLNLGLPDIRQGDSYDCGAAATMSVCRYFGVGPETEDDFVAMLGTNPADGTKVTHIIACLETLNLSVTPAAHMSPQELMALCAKGMPVICPVQMYGTPEQEAANQSGHYLVVTGVDGERVSYQDPSAGPGDMPITDFVKCWKDMDTDGTEYLQFGIAVGKGTKSYHKALAKLDHGPLFNVVSKFFRKQGKDILSRIKSVQSMTKALPDESFFDVKHWTEEMVKEVAPVVNLYYDEEAKKASVTIGRTKDDYGVLKNGDKVAFTRHTHPGERVMILVNAKKLDHDWSKDQGYIPPGGGGAEIGGRRQNFQTFLAKGEPIQASIVYMDDDGTINFEDGRHRFSVLRDLGIDKVCVMVEDYQVSKFEDKYHAKVTDLLQVVQPNLKEGMRQATFAFCEETNRTTHLQLTDAIIQLKENLAQGVESGEVKFALKQRVQEIFSQAETSRALQIGITEASRAQSSAMEITAKKSGVVKKKKWITSSRACPECQAMSGKIVEIGKNFTIDGESRPEYRDIPYPPRHPRCLCAVTPVVEGIND